MDDRVCKIDGSQFRSPNAHSGLNVELPLQHDLVNSTEDVALYREASNYIGGEPNIVTLARG